MTKAAVLSRKSAEYIVAGILRDFLYVHKVWVAVVVVALYLIFAQNEKKVSQPRKLQRQTEMETPGCTLCWRKAIYGEARVKHHSG